MNFRVQPAEAPAPIRKMLAASVFRQYRAKEIIVQQGTVSEEVYYVMRGSVTAEVYNELGQRLVFHYLNPGEFFGEMGMFEERLRRSATVIARTNCELAVVGFPQFRALIHEDPDLLMELTRQLAVRLRKTSEKLSDLAFLDVTGRIARTLMELAGAGDAITHPEGKMIRITREELGRIVNCSREMAGQVLHTLEDRGMIHLEGRSIVVHPARIEAAGTPRSD